MEYTTKFNYSDPYRVLIDGNKITVLLNSQDKLILEQNFIKIFVGISESHGSEYDGNTILVQESEHSYIWIGNKIIKFMGYEQIVDYKSPIGNNEVPYSWAIDSRGWIYLFLENVVIANLSG
jgi:hypothetical protein